MRVIKSVNELHFTLVTQCVKFIVKLKLSFEPFDCLSETTGFFDCAFCGLILALDVSFLGDDGLLLS